MPMTLADAFAAALFGARPQPTAEEIDEREAAALAEIERRNPSPKWPSKHVFCECGHPASEHEDAGAGKCSVYYDAFDPASGHYQYDCSCKQFKAAESP